MAGKEFAFGFTIAANIAGSFRSSFGAAGKEIQSLSTKIQINKKLVKDLARAQKEGIISAASYQNAISKINPEIDKLSKQQKKLRDQQSKISNLQGKMNSYGSNAVQYAGMAYGVAKLAQAAVDFEDAMSDVRKVVDFDTPEQFKQMGDDILEMSTRIPMAAEDLAQIVAAGGQSGIAKEDLLEFAESAAKMGVAFDVTADQAGEMMAKWRTAFKMSQPAVVELADKINYLGNTTAASALSISDVVSRVGPLGSVGGVASGEIAALGASMVGAGINSEIAATGIKNMILSLVSGPGVTKSQSAAFEQLGISSVQLAKDMQTDARGSILKVLKSIQQLDKASQATVMKDLFGKESLGAIAPLLSNLEGLEENFAKVGDATKYTGSMNDEYVAKAQTTANALKLMEGSVRRAQVSIGAGLLPAVASLAKGFAQAASVVGGFASKYPTLTAAIVGGIGVTFALAAAANAAMWAFSGLRLAGAGVSFMLGRYALLAKLNTAITLGMATVNKIVSASFTLLRGGIMRLWAVLMANPWIALATLAVGAAIMICQNWDTVKQWFTTLWDNPALALQQFCDGVKNMLGGALKWVQEKWQSISNMLSTPIFGKVNIAAEGAGAQVAQNASGGIYGRGAFLTSFAENDGESAIPHTPNRRNIGLLAKTNEIMGSPLGGGGSNISAVFSPQITVQGNADTAAIDSLMTQKMQEFKAMLADLQKQQRRVSYA